MLENNISDEQLLLLSSARFFVLYTVPYDRMHVDVVKKIRSKRLSWDGYVVRMDDDQPAKEVFSKELNGTR
uniref:Uncharacterized protein n=1 Tax=Megaselia scalaris TaxID=36166 RepID=T1GSU5_MEGSC